MVNTVLGPVDAAELGTTYIHEHLYVKPNELPAFYPYTLDDVDRGVEEIESFMAAGGIDHCGAFPTQLWSKYRGLKGYGHAYRMPHSLCDWTS